MYFIKNTNITQNKHAIYEYFIKQKIEAGISLQAWEVKSLRAGKVDIKGSYVLVKNGEAYLFGVRLQPISSISLRNSCDPNRAKKLLLNKYELNSLIGYITKKQYTIITLALYWKRSWIKATIALAKGKKKHDKRANIKEREWKINKINAIKHKN